MELQKLYEKITEQYSAKILNWAIKKTGNRSDGEDLAQEVLLQIFVSVAKEEKIEKLENFIWKIAHYTWCKHVKALVRRNSHCELSKILPDDIDFAQDYVDNDALQKELSQMRRKIADLSKLQREAIILHYLDDVPVREVAARLNITETAAAWHLFDARKKIKKELETMKNENTYVYKPGSLLMGAVGDVPQNPDIEKVNDSLIRQNVCLLCRNDGKTIDELAELIGISKPYLEYDLDWLVDREFLSFDGKRYQNTFIIMDKRHFEYRKAVYLQNKDAFEKLIDYVWEKEEKIRAINFYGSDFPSERMMWPVLILFLTYVFKNCDKLYPSELSRNEDCEIHKDGGKYHFWAWDKNDKVDITGFYDDSGWEHITEIDYDKDNMGFWLGIYNFDYNSANFCPEVITAEKTKKQLLLKLCKDIFDVGISQNKLTEEDKEKLAESVKCGLILKNGDSYRPNFAIFTQGQIEELQNMAATYLPEIEPRFIEMVKQFKKQRKADFPHAKQSLVEHHAMVDLFSSYVFFFKLAAEENKLYLPKTPEESAPLTLGLVSNRSLIFK